MPTFRGPAALMMLTLIGCASAPQPPTSEDSECGVANYDGSPATLQRNIFAYYGKPPSLKVLDCAYELRAQHDALEACAFSIDPSEMPILKQHFSDQKEDVLGPHRPPLVAQLSKSFPTELFSRISLGVHSYYLNAEHSHGVAVLYNQRCPMLEDR